MAEGHDPTRITEAEVAAFAQKQEEWGKRLPEEEQALLRMLVSAAAGAAPADVAGYVFNVSVREAASASLRTLTQTGFAGRIGWTKETGPDWMRSVPPLHL